MFAGATEAQPEKRPEQTTPGTTGRHIKSSAGKSPADTQFRAPTERSRLVENIRCLSPTSRLLKGVFSVPSESRRRPNPEVT